MQTASDKSQIAKRNLSDLFAWLLLAGLAISPGCAKHRAKHRHTSVTNSPIAPFQQFLAPNVEWASVKRVVLMPLANQTAYPKLSEEMQSNLSAELQRAGRFDMVVATKEDAGASARDVFTRGQFDEVELLRVAREYQADAVLFGQITQYHPYNPPRVGMSLLMVSPAEGIVIASSDGLWDARESATAEQARQHFQQTQRWPQNMIGADRALESPDVFQRFVSHQLAQSLMPTGGGPAPSSTDIILPVSGQETQNAIETDSLNSLPSNFLPPLDTTPPSVPPASETQ